MVDDVCALGGRVQRINITNIAAHFLDIQSVETRGITVYQNAYLPAFGQ
jgi:hypothetical protein